MQKNRTDNSQVALITGAARRIGAQIARKLHEAGLNVVIHFFNSAEEAELLCVELNTIRENSAHAVQMDLQNTAGLSSLVQQSVAIWGHLDLLVNNASRFYRTKIGEVAGEAWNDLMDSNVKAPFFLSQAAAPYLAKRKGSIVNIADIHGERPMRDYGVYCLSKAGLIMLTKVMAKELAPEVRVNAVSPGPGVWPEGESVLAESDKQRLIERTLLKKSGNEDEIAKAVLFLATQGDFITGQILSVDGGRLLRI